MPTSHAGHPEAAERKRTVPGTAAQTAPTAHFVPGGEARGRATPQWRAHGWGRCRGSGPYGPGRRREPALP